MSGSEYLASRGVQGAFTTVSSQLGVVLLRIVGTAVLARLIAPDVFGVMAIVIAINGLLVTLAVAGLPMAAIQAQRVSRSAKSWLFVINSGAGLIVGAIQFLIAPALAAFYGHPEIETAMRWMAVATVFAGLQGQAFAQLSRDLRVGRIAAAELIGQFVGTTIAIALASIAMPYGALIGLNLAAQVVSATLIVIWAKWSLSFPGRWASEVTQLVRAGAKIYSMQFIPVVSRQALVPLAGLFVPASALGYYERAQQQSVLPLALTVDKLQRVIVPILSRVRADVMTLGRFFEQSQRVLAYGSSLIFSLLAALSAPVVAILFGPGWEIAGQILQILCVGGAFRGVVSSTQWLFIAVGANGKGLLLSTWSYPAITLASLLGIPVAGVMGMAAFNSIAWAIMWPISVWLACRAASIPSRAIIMGGARAMFLLSLPSGLCAYAAVNLVENPWLSVCVGSAAFLAAGGAVVLALPWVRRDVSQVLQALRRIRRG